MFTVIKYKRWQGFSFHLGKDPGFTGEGKWARPPQMRVAFRWQKYTKYLKRKRFVTPMSVTMTTFAT